ncbi:NB-ARC domain-containing protein [Actinokineospora sp.]|uniref:NB-ARC domain-containing protein n=1 Tax=Actinokineospora sp. TaxID=1872133 RepID=UPI004037F89B
MGGGEGSFGGGGRDGVPFQLPAVPSGFVARERELAELDGLRGSVGVGLVVVCGIAGVGKTSLALRWLHGLGAGFGDGCLFVDLTDAGTGEPVSASVVLEWFLVSLGVSARRVPVEAARRAALFRSVTAGRALVVLLDNAVSAAQVRALLPAGAGSVVVVTSRSRLSGLALDGARWVDVAPLGEGDALRLFGSVVGGDRVGAEVDAARWVARLCGGLPLALSVVAARLAARSRRTFAREAGDLCGEGDRLAGLTLDAETSVEAVLEVSCAGLGGAAAEVFCCCAWHPGREFGAEVVAAAVGRPSDRVVRGLDGLVEAGMVTESAVDRFTVHDLVRLHARGRYAEDGERVQRRMVRWYLDRVVAADVVIHPLRPRLGPRYAEVDVSVFADAGAALAWLAAERANVRAALETAAARWWDELVWQFCEALWGFFLHTRRYGEWIDLQRIGIASARRCGDRRAEALVRVQLGYAYVRTGRHEEAVEQHTISRDLARAEGDVRAEATALEQLGLAARGGSAEFFEQARDLHERVGNDRGVALCRRRIGEVLAEAGRLDEAVVEFAAAAEVMARLEDPTQHARAVTMLGAAHLRAERPEHATRVLRAALDAMRAFGSPYYQAEILALLGDATEQGGDRASALRCWAEAAELYERVGDGKADLMRSRPVPPPDGPHRT